MDARSITMKTAAIACLAMLLSCGGEATPPVAPPVTPPAPPAMPISGAAVAGMEYYDQMIPALMQKFKIPGGAVAVVRDGRLIYARGFGYADVEKETPMPPDALFRIASVSKPITSAAIMTLVADGKLALDDRVAPLIAHLTPAEGKTVDPRWEQVTIRQLLNHTGGWDRTKAGGFDPMDQPWTAATAVNAPAPASAETIIRYMKGMPLDFNPGAKWVYSNFGYTILGRVIEKLSGMPYEQYVRERVLLPLGAARTRSGKSRMSDALPGEVKYYWPGMSLFAPTVPSVFPGEGIVPLNYGGFHIEAMNASGGWVSSTVDLLRFLTGVDGRANRPDILSPQLVAAMTSSGPPVPCLGGGCTYAGGWWVKPTQGDVSWWHGGDLPGATAMLTRAYNNTSWIALFNGNSLFSATQIGNFDFELETALWDAIATVGTFPTHDLFSSFP
jgi:CubicO group peptidase (beta-lactamase class C family)